MHAILTYIVLLLSLLMFVVNRENKICLLLIYLLCFNSVFAPTLKGILLPQIFFFLSELRYYKQYIILIKKTNFKYSLFILLFGLFVLWINSPHMIGVKGFIQLFSYEFIRKYGILFFMFVACLQCKSQKPIIKVSLLCLIIITGFGILNFITKHAIYVDWVSAGIDPNAIMGNAGAAYTNSERFRVQAMFANPFDYGYVCLILLLYFWYLFKGKLIKKNTFYIALACCLFGIFTCGCRTLLACFIIACFIYLLFGYNLKSKLKFSIAGIILFFAVAIIIPNKLINQISFLTSALTDDQSVQGSSLTMRQGQTVTVLYYIRNNMTFGRGYDFFTKDLGWGGGKDTVVDRDLYGLEGVYLSMLLERGVFGLILYALYWISILWIVWKLYKGNKDKNTLALNISVIASYIAFANMTGELSSVPITLTIVGLSLACSNKNSSMGLNRK